MSLSLPRLCQGGKRPQSRQLFVLAGVWWEVSGVSLFPPQIVSAQSRVCVGWCVVGGVFVLAGVWWEVSGVSLSLPRLCQPQCRPVCVGWCVVGGKRRGGLSLWWEVSSVPSPPDCVSPSAGLFVLCQVSPLSLPRLCQPQSRPVCVGWCVVGGKRRVPSLPRLCQPQSRTGHWWVVGGKRRVPLPPQIASA